MILSCFAPAKINLYLHVTGRRPDGYHLLDSLVVFADVGDRLSLRPAAAFSFDMTGPMAPLLSGEDPEKNLATRAARALAAALDRPLDVALTLDKHLPVASGIGGGSTDAAAALRLLAAYWGLDPLDPRLFTIARSLGQDVPCCIEARPCYFRGIGDEMDQGPALPPLPFVLVNPGQGVPTPAVFKNRAGPFTPAAPALADGLSVIDIATALTDRSNSLTESAQSLLPAIGDVLGAIQQAPDCLLSRMSGSGATCFGLFPSTDAAQKAAAALQTTHPDWWIRHGSFQDTQTTPVEDHGMM